MKIKNENKNVSKSFWMALIYIYAHVPTTCANNMQFKYLDQCVRKPNSQPNSQPASQPGSHLSVILTPVHTYISMYAFTYVCVWACVLMCKRVCTVVPVKTAFNAANYVCHDSRVIISFQFVVSLLLLRFFKWVLRAYQHIIYVCMYIHMYISVLYVYITSVGCKFI